MWPALWAWASGVRGLGCLKEALGVLICLFVWLCSIYEGGNGTVELVSFSFFFFLFFCLLFFVKMYYEI